MSRFPLYISEYNDGQRMRSKRAHHLGLDVDWPRRLPPDWRPHTIGPIWVEVNRDRWARAERWIGFDEEDLPCYCRYRFPLSDFLQEDLVAWRMRDGRWLIHRVIAVGSQGREAYDFYVFSERMPK